MEGSIYDCINHIKYVGKKKPAFGKILASKSKLDTVDNLDADKLRKLLPVMIKKKLLELSDNVYKIKGKDTVESALPEISETETLVLNETQMENNIESPTISNNDAEILPHDIDQPADWKKNNKCNRRPLH